MDNILNLALKKDVFESIVNGYNDKIAIGKTNWWKKRLMDVDSGKFKDFNIARISSGSSDKLDYKIINIELINDDFVITILQETNSEPVEEEVEVEIEETQEPEIEDLVDRYTEMISEIKEDVKQNAIEVPEPEHIEVKKEDVKKTIMNLLNEVCGYDDVYTIVTPVVSIRKNGQIVGSKQYFCKKVYNEHMFELQNHTVTRLKWMTDEDFIEAVMNKFKELLNGNYVFIKKNSCGFKKIESGELEFVLRATVIRKYMADRL